MLERRDRHGGKGSGEAKWGNVILRVEPRGCEPSVLAVCFESGKLGVVLVHEGFTVGRDGPEKKEIRGVPPSEHVTDRERRTYSNSRSRAMPYLRRLIVAMSVLPSSSLSALSGMPVSSWFSEYTLSMMLVRITGHRLTTVS